MTARSAAVLALVAAVPCAGCATLAPGDSVPTTASRTDYAVYSAVLAAEGFSSVPGQEPEPNLGPHQVHREASLEFNKPPTCDPNRPDTALDQMFALSGGDFAASCRRPHPPLRLEAAFDRRLEVRLVDQQALPPQRPGTYTGLHFSPIWYSADGKLAVLHIDAHCWGGHGDVVLVGLTDGKWRVLKRMMTWIS